MVLILKGLVLLSAVAVVYCNVECRSNYDCGSGECCVFVMGKHGSTTCQSQRRQFEQCRPNDKPSNYTLRDPSDSSVKVTDVYYMLCPCHIGLVCDPYKGICVQGIPSGSESHPAQVPH